MKRKTKKIIKDIDKKRGRKREDRLQDQLALVAGYDIERKIKLTLKDIIERKMKKLPELPEEKKSEITIDRIKAQKEFKLYFLQEDGQIEIDKDTAIKEISEGSDIGKELIEIEMQALEFAFEEISKQKEGE